MRLPEGIKRKRPSKGYNTEKEREYAKVSLVSDWEIYLHKKYIGLIFRCETVMGSWVACVGDRDNEKNLGYFQDMTDAVWELHRQHKLMGE
tara:strand:+ start:213 stop:485 length:273 start_codon:yes stop_codon:yes gene_type:complete